MREDKSLLISYLEQQKMDDSLIHDVVEFREKYETAEEVQERVYIPDMLFYGKDILEMSAAALLLPGTMKIPLQRREYLERISPISGISVIFPVLQEPICADNWKKSRKGVIKMSVFADCQDERNKKTIQEIDCPECMEEDGLEVFLKDGVTVGESTCTACGYVIPEGVNLGQFLEE